MFSISDAAVAGVSRGRICQLEKAGDIRRLARGVYIGSDVEPSETAEVEILAKLGSKFVLTTESALRFHGLTSVMPHELTIAMKRGARTPDVDFPLRVMRTDETSFEFGAAEYELHGTRVRIYSVAKTIADVFKFRNRIGIDLALEALREGWRTKRFTIDELMAAAEVDRVRRVITPYLEGMIA